jgi:hypothetical protein
MHPAIGIAATCVLLGIDPPRPEAARDAPAAPSGVIAKALADTMVLLTWDNPPEGGAPSSIAILRQDGVTGDYAPVKSLAPGHNL